MIGTVGRIYDALGSLTYANEAEVSQKFLVPLLAEHLGYDRNAEILPERHFAAFDIPQNRKERLSSRELLCRPDYVLVVGSAPVAVVDSKDPNENLDDHLDQLRAYCIGAGTNQLRTFSLLECSNAPDSTVAWRIARPTSLRSLAPPMSAWTTCALCDDSPIAPT